MTARTGMSNLITQLRAMTNAGTADTTIAGVAYWSDDQLQDVLDRNRVMLDFYPLQTITTRIAGGSVEYKEYRSQYGNLESGTAVFALKDGLGSAIGTASYTADYNAGVFTFASDTGGTSYYIDARSYNLNASAADVWQYRAGQAASGAYSWATDNMRVDKKDMVKVMLDTANYFRAQAGTNSVDMVRGDELYDTE